MKKFLIMCIVFLSVLAVLSCGATTTETQSSQTTGSLITRPSTTTISTTSDESTTATTQLSEEGCVVDRSGISDSDLVSLDYFSWDPQEVESKMICTYQQLNPNVVVNFRTDIRDDATAASKDWTSYLVELASATGYIPDVFQISNIETAAEGKLLMDFASIFNADSDTEHLFQSALDAGLYGDKRLAMSNGQVMRGVMINKNLLEDLNLSLRNYGFNSATGSIWNVDQMIQLARDFTTQARGRFTNDYYYGIDGEYSQLGFNLYFPAAYNDDLTYYSIVKDTNRFDFTSSATKFIDSYQLEIDLLKQGIRPNMTLEQMAIEFGSSVSSGDLFFTYARTLLYHCFTYTFTDMYLATGSEFMFYPLPVGTTVGSTAKTFGATGLIGLSKQLENDPEKALEAYKLGKFMTWAEDGFNERININVELGQVIPKFPVSDYENVWNRITEIYSDTESLFYIEGLDIVIDNLLNGEVVMSLDKTIPGINSFKNWLSYKEDESHRKAVLDGTMNVADVALIWEQRANSYLSEWENVFTDYPNGLRNPS